MDADLLLIYMGINRRRSSWPEDKGEARSGAAGSTPRTYSKPSTMSSWPRPMTSQPRSWVAWSVTLGRASSSISRRGCKWWSPRSKKRRHPLRKREEDGSGLGPDTEPLPMGSRRPSAPWRPGITSRPGGNRTSTPGRPAGSTSSTCTNSPSSAGWTWAPREATFSR